MARQKRSFEGEDAAGLDDVHSSRKKRFKYTQEDAQLAEIYNNLADEVQSVRIQAAAELLKTVSAKSSGLPQSIETAGTRLIKGLCSGRKAARLGFSIALAEIFRLNFDENSRLREHSATLLATVEKIVNLTTPQGNASGQEKRDHFLGRRFAFQALLQSDVGLDTRLPNEQWQYLTKSIFELASQKQWLRRECGTMLYEYLASQSASQLDRSRIRIVVDELIDAQLAKTTEGIGIWIIVQKHFPQVKLPKGIWRHRDPLASRELPVLSKAMLETPSDGGNSAIKSGARQSTPSFAWSVILSRFYERGDDDDFAKFWDSVVASTMFSLSSSAERKALGFQILSLAVFSAPRSMLLRVLSARNIISCILDERASPGRYLFHAANVPLQGLAARAKEEPGVASLILRALIEKGTPNFDQLTKSKTVDSVLSNASEEALEQIVTVISKEVETPAIGERHDAESLRRMLADLLLIAVRIHCKAENVMHRDANSSQEYSLVPWAVQLLESLVVFGYELADSHADPAIQETTRKTFRLRLMSCIGHFLDRSIDKAVVAPLHVAKMLFESSHLRDEIDQRQREAVAIAIEASNDARRQSSAGSVTHAFQLLFSLSIIQVYSGEADSLAVLEDLILCYQSLGNKDDSSTILIELLLSFISKPSALFRRMAEQVFVVFAPQLTSESMESFIDILVQKESLSGQQTLFEQHAEGERRSPGSGEDDESVVDVEDASDVELVNGHEVVALDKDTDDESEASSESLSEAEGVNSEDEEDEVAAFDKKLADALGTSGLADSDDDGSDMDDEQMMALEPHLASIFHERQKATSKKNEKKDARENIVNFKNRVLDLLMIYVKNQSSNVLTLDLILPLTTLIRRTTSKATGEKAFTVLKTYYEACNKNKAWPRSDEPALCLDILKDVHKELKVAGSKLHANACSRASLFLSKVLVGLDPGYYKRIAELYAELQSEWYSDAKSRVPGSVFTEWTSWSINTRKQL